MELPTKDDIERLIFILGAVGPMSADPQAAELASKLTGLLNLYDKTGLPVSEVDIHLNTADAMIYGPNQIHTYNVGDEYSEEGFLGTIRELKAHIAHR